MVFTVTFKKYNSEGKEFTEKLQTFRYNCLHYPSFPSIDSQDEKQTNKTRTKSKNTASKDLFNSALKYMAHL